MAELEKFTKYDAGKPQWHLVPNEPMESVVRVLTFGAQKYSADNWKKCRSVTRYLDAAFRHVWAYLRGEDLDPESGEHHLAHSICCLLFAMGLGEDADDR